ncbi:MAG: hypothetical protein WAS21_08575 [Geminicoccaceae bacterium]
MPVLLSTRTDCLSASIMQAADNGLTGGSTADGDDYGRGVIISTLRMTKLQ